jgi:hypothetical protein
MMKSLAHIDKNAQDNVNDLVKEISALCGENMTSMYLYGSAAGKGYDPERSNFNILILLKVVDMETLKGIARIYRKKGKSRIVAPLVLTQDYVKSSTDVFPIEFLEIKESSILLSGGDVLKDAAIDLSRLREQCEREIKGQLLRMRGTFLEVEGDQKGMEKLVVTSISNLIFPLKNILRLMEREVSDGNAAVIRDCCKALNVADSAFIEAWGIKKEERKVSLDGLYTVISGYMASLEEIAGKIDEMKLEGRL